jgi:Acetoacetate decarboxylase (ADC)
MFAPRPDTKYDMPAVFGPSLLPDHSTFGEVDMVSISHVTTRAAAAPLVPHHFELPDDPVVTYSRMTYRNVDYLGGRGYEELTVGISARCDTESSEVRGSYMPVVWIDDSAALVAGREYMGYAKIGGELPSIDASDTAREFEVREYGAPLLRGVVEGIAPLDAPRLESARAAAAATTVLGWKYITGPGGIVDADYPTSISLSFEWAEAWTGDGRITFAAPGVVEAPFSSRIVAALAALPVVRSRRAFIAAGRGSIDRAATTRLRSTTPRPGDVTSR